MCSAWILGPDRDRMRSNDDGEPSGTAGTPMLDVLTGADLALADSAFCDERDDAENIHLSGRRAADAAG